MTQFSSGVLSHADIIAWNFFFFVWISAYDRERINIRILLTEAYVRGMNKLPK